MNTRFRITIIQVYTDNAGIADYANICGLCTSNINSLNYIGIEYRIFNNIIVHINKI